MILAIIGFSGIILTVLHSVEHASIIWLTISHISLVAFLPIINIPIPAQINDISKVLVNYLRMDIFGDDNQSFMSNIA